MDGGRGGAGGPGGRPRRERKAVARYNPEVAARTPKAEPPPGWAGPWGCSRCRWAPQGCNGCSPDKGFVPPSSQPEKRKRSGRRPPPRRREASPPPPRWGAKGPRGDGRRPLASGAFVTPMARLLRRRDTEVCHVCGEPWCDDVNPILLCDGCDVPVHQFCYGVDPGVAASDAPWFCDGCLFYKREKSVQRPAEGMPVCALCPAPWGALRVLSQHSVQRLPRHGMLNGQRARLVHAACITAVPEAYCEMRGTAEDRAFVGQTSGVDAERWELQCELCKIPHGAPVQCSAGNCYLAFHPLCARAAGQVTAFDPTGRMHVFCASHSAPRHAATRALALDVGTATQKKQAQREYAAHVEAQMREEVAATAGPRSRWLLQNWSTFQPLQRDPRAPPPSALLEAAGAERAVNGGRGAETEASPSLVTQPKTVLGKLRGYQLEGLRWLVGQGEKGIGGILGDEMGLGKTLQVIAFLAYRKVHKNDTGPHLIVAPLSVLNSWMSEFRRWCPSMKVVSFQGTQNERGRIRDEHLRAKDFEVLITTYETLVAEKVWLWRSFYYSHIVLDEAHRVKNMESQLAGTIFHIRSLQRILLTGTPLQNNLSELWTLLRFLLPDAVHPDSQKTFAKGFVQGGGAMQVEQSCVQAARDLLGMLMLRRTKAEVLAKELPPKREEVVTIEMAPVQKDIYRKLLEGEGSIGRLAELNGVLPEGEQEPGKYSNRFRSLSNLLLQLRKCSLHPALFEGEHQAEAQLSMDEMVQQSGKLTYLDKLLPKLRKEGHKVLFFSGFTSFLDILQAYLADRNHPALRLDGSTSVARRRYETATFNQEGSEYFAYLISLKAGGVGLNLQGADTVIIMEPQWNPTFEAQAQDRCHRIGQTRPVTVYRLCSRGSCEESILEVAAQKVQMSKAVMETEEVAFEPQAKLSFREIVEVISRGAGKLLEEGPRKSDRTTRRSSAASHGAASEPGGAGHWKSFQGVNYEGASGPRDIAEHWVAGMKKGGKRTRRSVNVDVDTRVFGLGKMSVSKWSIDREAREARMEEKRRSKRRAAEEERALRVEKHEALCAHCHEVNVPGLKVSPWRPDNLQYNERYLCRLCPRIIHAGCLVGTVGKSGYICPQHKCQTCSRSSSDAGGLIFRCVSCLAAFCDECMRDGFEPLPSHPEWEALGFTPSQNYEYIRCSDCIEAGTEVPWREAKPVARKRRIRDMTVTLKVGLCRTEAPATQQAA